LPLTPGSRLGPYEILAPLGAGGMGEVYKAKDTRLGRDVAIKVLPAEFSADSARLQRFEQEARAASALNHPNIVTIHDIGQVDSVPYIAMELIEGNSLRELMSAGPISVRKLLGIAAQAAEGLAKAHSAGIVHRDLKPENLMVSTDGFVKILDFGLAKLTVESAETPSRVPTIARPETHPGTVMGTVGYMSPEQAAGQTLDFRSDQFSFGSILYEMATGQRAFQRATSVDTLSAILHEEPEPIASLAPRSPAPLRWIAERCLAKDPRERYASTVDLARDLASVRQHISELSGGEATLPSTGRPRHRERLAWSIATATLVLGLVVVLLARGRVATSRNRQLMRLNLTFPSATSPIAFLADISGPVLSLSPDGTHLVYVGVSSEGRRLYLRSLDQFSVTPISGTEGGASPFFSPDGQWIGFWADRKLKKVSLAGGQPLTLCDAAVPRGASWGPDGTILFSPWSSSSLWRVSDKGGDAKPFTTLDAAKGEGTHRWPEILPGGKTAIFTIHGTSGNYDDARIGAVHLETGERKSVLQGGTDARYLSTGHLVYLRSGSLYAVPFDLKGLAVTGPPVPVLDDVGYYGIVGRANYAFSASGTLVYFGRDLQEAEGQLVWVDRKGVTRPIMEARRSYSDVRISPDGSRVATVVGHPGSDIWIYDLERNSWDRLTSGSLHNNPVWTPDGQRLAFASNRSGSFNAFWMPIDRSQPAEQLTRSDQWIFPTSFSPDGRSLLVNSMTPNMGADIAVVSLDGDRTTRTLLRTPSSEEGARFSPNGHWIAYQSDESGRAEVYVTGYPGPGGRHQISTEGGEDPVWSRDGLELFYWCSGKLMGVAVKTAAQFSAGLPKPLFEMKDLVSYDVSPDGQRFAAVRATARDSASSTLAVVLNWFEDIKRRTAVTESKRP
jgi:serine/threonine-protein kinase